MNKVDHARLKKLMPGGKPRYVRCYDAGETVSGRYTVVFVGKSYHQHVSMSAHPHHPEGVCVYDESPTAIDRPESSFLGELIAFDDLPADCQRLVVNTYKDIWGLSK